MHELLQESRLVELKEKLNNQLEKEVVAFLNSREGGDLYIGVRDNGTALDLPDLDQLQCTIADRLKNNIQPATLGLFDVIKERYQGHTIIHIVVSSGPEKPYYIGKYGLSSKGCFIRVGSTSQPLDGTQIDALYSRRICPSLRNIPSPRQDLTFEQLLIYYQSKGRTLNDYFAKTLDLLTEDGRYNYVAYLLADHNSVSIKVATFAGTDKVELIENEEYGYGSLLRATKSVWDRLNSANRTLARITYPERIEQRLVEPTALREAVLNAIIHNDYTREVPPVFEIYSDRIEVVSYGGLVKGMSEADFFGGRSMPRNRELMRVYRDLDLVEQLGSGMNRILKSYDKSAFHISEHFLAVSFAFRTKLNPYLPPQANLQSLPHAATQQVTPQATPQVSPQTTSQVGQQDTPQDNPPAGVSDRIFAYCAQPRSKKEIASAMGLKDINHITEHYLKPLLQSGRLVLTIPEKPTSCKQKYVANPSAGSLKR